MYQKTKKYINLEHAISHDTHESSVKVHTKKLILKTTKEHNYSIKNKDLII